MVGPPNPNRRPSDPTLCPASTMSGVQGLVTQVQREGAPLMHGAGLAIGGVAACMPISDRCVWAIVSSSSFLFNSCHAGGSPPPARQPGCFGRLFSCFGRPRSSEDEHLSPGARGASGSSSSAGAAAHAAPPPAVPSFPGQVRSQPDLLAHAHPQSLTSAAPPFISKRTLA